jgi:predicted NUDIX family NTP pyrophosphohydrolase
MLQDDTIYRGDIALGEIEITGVRRIWTHRFWSELQFSVRMPPKTPGGEPVSAAFAGIVPAHKFHPGVSALVIVDEEHVALIKMYRFHGSPFAVLPRQRKGWRIEAPRGGYKPGETPDSGALREATEEAGIAQRPDTQVIDLGMVEPDSGLLMSQVALRAVRNVDIDRNKVHLDVTEAPT